MVLRFDSSRLMMLALVVLTGCAGSGGSRDGADGAAVEDRSISSAEMDAIDAARSRGVTDDPALRGSSLEAGGPLLDVRVVYFDYDSANVRAEFRDVVEAHARYLEQNPSVIVTLQGHADERGSREYNLALGETRALAVRKQLALLGASADQVRAVSFGEEKPISEGHDESAYGLNRRVELVY